MGTTISVSAQIEILAPPYLVRSIFMDFPRYKQWQQGWEIEPVDSGKKSSELYVGDRLKVNMHGMTFHPVVEGNAPDCFTWQGSLYGLFAGKHRFIFSPSEENPGGTTFIQREDFSGPVMIFFWPWRNKKWSMDNWDAFNAALKKQVEKSAS
ncbi:Fc.00g046130.m01.CDS01 [Cosmosporella sp. VM-42]